MPRGTLTEEQRERSDEANRNQDRSRHSWNIDSFRFEPPPCKDSPYTDESELYFRNNMHGKMDDINDSELIIEGTG